MRRWVLGIAALSAVVAMPRAASGDARAEARRHFEAGMEHIAEGRYREGIEELERADRILPHPSVRYNIARAWDDAGELELAFDAYRQYLETDPPDRADVERAVKRLERRMAERRAPTPAAPTPPASPEAPASPAEPPSPPAARPRDVYEERVVTASRRAQSPLDAPSSTTIVTRQDIRLSGITRIPELLRRVAGMDVMQITGGDANVSVRGLNSRLSNKLLVLVNGRSVKNDLLGSTFWEALSIDVDQIERIEVVRGPGSSLYGADAFVGVVNIITLRPGEGGTGARVGYGERNTVYGSAWASARDGDFAWRASVGYTRYPRWTREIAPGRVDIALPDVDQDLGAQNARADVRTSYRVGREQELEIGGGFNRTDLDVYGVGPFNDYAVHIDAGDVSGVFRSELVTVRGNYTGLGASAAKNGAYHGHSLYETRPLQHSFASDVELHHAFRLPDALEHAVVAGVSYRLKAVEWDYLVDDPPTEHHVGVFGQEALRFAERFGVIASGRVDYVPSLERLVPSARGTFVVQPGEAKRQAVRASVATAFRSPTFLEAHLSLPVELALGGLELASSSRRQDDPDFRVGPENILAAELGYLNQESDDFQIEIAAYYHRITDLIVLADPRPDTLSDVATGVSGLNPQTGRYRVAAGGWDNTCAIEHAVGGEVGGRWYGVEGLDVFASYAVQYGVQELPEGCAVPADERTSHHKINVGAQVRTAFGLDGEIVFHYQTGQVWVEQVAGLESIDYRRFDIDGYHLLNGRVGYRFLDDRASVSVVAFNALSDLFAPPPQMHPFGNRVGRTVMGFVSFEQ